MTPLDIVYTTLDTDPVPDVDLDKLFEWINIHKPLQILPKRDDASESMSAEQYPWNIIYPRYQFKWYADFDQLFPELTDFICNSFCVDVEDIQDVVMLPLKKDFIGTGFFHSDPDECRIRFYLANNEPKDFLLIKETRLPYTVRDQMLNNTRQDFKDHVHSARLLKSNQAFFINNVRAIHAVNSTQPNPLRIAVTITIPKLLKDMPKSLEQLVVDSAVKYKEYSILWNKDIS